MDETSLLHEYTQTQSEEAFAKLVEHHTDWVFGYCLRRLKDQEQAEEATHVVFIVLSRKAKSIPSDRPLASWLFKTAQYTVAQMQRTERRKRNLEEKARTVARPSIVNEPSSAAKPTDVLDKALETLKNTDREAILLRFYENKSLRETGNMLKISEAAAQKRVDRAVERLHQYFNEQGAVLSLVGLTGMLTAMSSEHARADLAASIVKSVMGKAAGATAAAAATTEANTIAKGVMKTMFWQQVKTPALIAGIALAGGTAAMAVSLQNNTVAPLGNSKAAQNTPALTESAEMEREKIKARLAAIAAKLDQPRPQPLSGLQQQFAEELDTAGALGFRVLNQDILSSLRARNVVAAARLIEILRNLDHDGLHLDDEKRWKRFGTLPMDVSGDTLTATLQNTDEKKWAVAGLFFAQPFDLSEYSLSLRLTCDIEIETDKTFVRIIHMPIEAEQPDEALERALVRAANQPGDHRSDKPMARNRYRYEFLFALGHGIVRENGRVVSRSELVFNKPYLAIQFGAKGQVEPVKITITDVSFKKKGVGTPLDDF